jgi:hypothetical protein
MKLRIKAASIATALAFCSGLSATAALAADAPAASVLTYDKASNALVKSPDQVMTFHNHATSVPKEKHDAAWDAYVAEYKANSEISSETIVCMP